MNSTRFARRLRGRFSVRPHGAATATSGFTLPELLIVVLVSSVILLAISRFFVNYYITYQEAQTRLKMQRDMRSLAYWVRKDLTALAQRSNNFDLKNGSRDYAFLAADDPTDTLDSAVNTTDNGLDSFSYVFSGNKATRTWNPGGTQSSVVRDIMLECIDPNRGDTYDVNITLRDLNDSVVQRSQFDATLGNFDYAIPIRRVDVELIFSKRPAGAMFTSRSPILERAVIKSTAMYRRGA